MGAADLLQMRADEREALLRCATALLQEDKQVDWYWQPRSGAHIPREARVLFDRAGIPLAPAPEPQTPQERAQAAADRTIFFWAMIPIAAKYVARRGPWSTLSIIRMVGQTLDEVRELAGIESPHPRYDDTLPPAQPGEQLARLREMTGQMERVMPLVTEMGGQVSAEVVPQVHRFFDLVEAMIAE